MSAPPLEIGPRGEIQKTKKSCAKDDENIITSPSGEIKRKKPDHNVGIRSKIEVIHEETVVFQEEAVRRQPRSPRGVNKDIHEEAVSSPRGDSTVKYFTRSHLSSPLKVN